MSQPFSGFPNPGNPRFPDPGTPSPFKRREQPRVFQDALEKVLRGARRHGEAALRAARLHGSLALMKVKRHGQNLWFRVNRNPRAFGLGAGAVGLALIGAVAINASNSSLCPPTRDAKKPPFVLLMDSVPHPAAGSDVTIDYDVCGLKSGTAYRGRVQLSQLVVEKKKKKTKKSAKPKPLVLAFKDQVDGPASRRSQLLKLGATKPGAYSLELSVVDNQGRKRTKVQKVVVRASS